MSFQPEGVHTAADGGQTVYLVGDTYTVLLTAQQSAGRLGMIEAIVPAQAGPPPHVHHREAETFVLIEGRLLVTAGEEEYQVSPGGVVHVPQGMRHSFRNTSPTTPAKMVVVFTPAGLEAMFTEIGTPGTRGRVAPPLTQSDVDAMGAVATRYGYTFEP